MNWLNKLSEHADRFVQTMDANLQQPVTEAMLFTPLHQDVQAAEMPAIVKHEPVENNAPLNDQPTSGHPGRGFEPKPVPSARLKHA